MPTRLKLPPITSHLPFLETSSSWTYGEYWSRDSLIGRLNDVSSAPVVALTAARPRTETLLILPNMPPRISRLPTSAKSLTRDPAIVLKLVSRVPSRRSLATRMAFCPLTVVKSPAMRIDWPSAV